MCRDVHAVLFVAAVCIGMFVAGCPGTTTSCESDGDCFSGEICVDGSCRKERRGDDDPDDGGTEGEPDSSEGDTSDSEQDGGSSTEEDCIEPGDEDGDGKVNCRDSDCTSGTVCATDPEAVCGDQLCQGGEVGEDCRDGEDNDHDGKVDCDDPDCDSVCPCKSDCTEDCTNDKDDDFDGVTNNGCKCVYPHNDETGVCAKSHGEARIGPEGECVPAPKFEPVETTCDGLDNDCDGTIDEGCPCDLEEDGECGKGRVGMENGDCKLPPSQRDESTSCIPDALDNDCDGKTDENCTSCGGDNALGICEFSWMNADSGMCGKPVTHVSRDVPSTDEEEPPEDCNGLDNDCDGTVDEGCRCDYDDTNVGVCRNGTVESTDDGTGKCGVPEFYEPNEQNCDGRDNDCDGETDEQCETCRYDGSFVGVCRYGRPSGSDDCTAPSSHVDERGRDEEQAPEDCDGLDNDCDGVVDENCACQYRGLVHGVCATATRDDETGECEPPEATDYESTETSCDDGADNDCDGLVDDEDPDC